MPTILVSLSAGPALACGGFFCDSVEPVEQAGERILFREDEQGWTAFVEVRFAGPPIDFGWVLPIPVAIDPERDVTTAPPGLFDDLEQATATRFVAAADEAMAPSAYADYASAGCDAGCGPIGEPWASSSTFTPDTSGVDVIGEAVVGPYELQVITAGEGENLVNWLQQAGYTFPYSAWPTVDAYVEQDYAFLGVKLAPDVPTGPIDTLVLNCGQDRPEIPLLMTAIAAVPDMEIIAYVLADERYVPDERWPEIDLDVSGVRSVEGATRSYELVLKNALDAHGGRGWRTEYAGPEEAWTDRVLPETMVALGHGGYLTRLHTFVSPAEMTSDPTFVPDPSAPDLDNVLYVGAMTSTAAVGPAALLLGLAMAASRRRRIA